MRLSRSSWWTKPGGGAGWLATAGMAAGIVTWWPIAAGAAGGWFVLAMAGFRRSRRAMLHLKEAFPEATRTDPYAATLEGTCDGVPFRVHNSIHSMHVLVHNGLPDDIVIERERAARWRIGDPEFDALCRVYAHESLGELTWRVMLTSELRAELRDVFGTFEFQLHGGWFDVVIMDIDADGATIEKLVRGAAALSKKLWERIMRADKADMLAWFVQEIPREPVARVRLAHFEWLVNGGYEVPAVLKLAAEDPDPDIRRWAQAQRPSETLYR